MLKCLYSYFAAYQNNLKRVKSGYTVPLFKQLSSCVPEACIKGRDKWSHPTDTVGCNSLSLSLIRAFGTQAPICFSEAILVALGIPAENFRFFQCTEQSSYCRELEYSTLESYNSTTKDTDVVRIVLVNNGPGTPLGYVPANIHFGTPDPRVPCYMALLGRQNIQGISAMLMNCHTVVRLYSNAW